MGSYPRIKIQEVSIDLVRESLTDDAPLLEEMGWSEVDSIEIVGLDGLDDEFRTDRPLSITIEAADLKVESVESSDDDIREFQEELNEETDLVYYPGSNSVGFDEEKSNNENFEQFVDFMFREDYIEMSHLPISMPNAKKNFILNDSKETLNGDGEMDHAKGMFVNGSFDQVYYNPKDPKGQKKEHIKHMIDTFVKDEDSDDTQED